jgi:hypothetical protein
MHFGPKDAIGHPGYLRQNSFLKSAPIDPAAIVLITTGITHLTYALDNALEEYLRSIDKT